MPAWRGESRPQGISPRASPFGSELENQFPFDSHKIDAGSRIPYTAEQLALKLEKLQSFALAYPQFIPGTVGSSAFLDRFLRDAPGVLENEEAIREYLNGQSDYIVLCHWNMNLDNAWFWRDERGQLQADDLRRRSELSR